MSKVDLVRLFVSHPSDVKEEVKIIGKVCDDFNKTSGKEVGCLIEVLNWEEDIYSDSGREPQDVVESQMKYDVLVGIIWEKLGTPTSKSESGTASEIEAAIRDPEKIASVYFNVSPNSSLSDLNIEELQRIRKFKGKLQELGELYHEYKSIDEFESNFKFHLFNLVRENFGEQRGKRKSLPKKRIDGKYS